MWPNSHGIATKACGLDINQPDIEVVVKVGVPQSLEELIQGFGRAGRDGRVSSRKKCNPIHPNCPSYNWRFYQLPVSAHTDNP